MSSSFSSFLSWITSWMTGHDTHLWGTADLRRFDKPRDRNGHRYPSAISMALAMDPQIMATVQLGPNTDLNLPFRSPIERSYCGRCTRRVNACPADALIGTAWDPGISREEILDVTACDRWKKKHFYQYHNGHNCGICSAVCPYGLKALRKTSHRA